MYRALKATITVADDSSLRAPLFGPRDISLYNSKDLESVAPTLRIAPADNEAQVSLGTVSTGYFVAILSDYPVMVRFNGPSATQFTLKSSNVAAVNLGAPLPDSCCFLATFAVTSIYLTPIAGAQQTANVKVVVTGDPASSYT